MTRRASYISTKYGKRFNIWEYTGGKQHTRDFGSAAHPAIFPEGLAHDHILSWNNPGDMVLDPFCGSGTTCKMAKMLERNYLGFDISEEYIELARKRLRHTGTPLPFGQLLG